MGANVQTTTVRTNTLIYNYLPLIRDILGTATPLMDRIKTKGDAIKSPDGKAWVIDVEYGPHGGMGYQTENAVLPAAGSRKDIQASYNVKTFHLVTDWTTLAMAELESKQSSFSGDGIQHTLKTALKDAAREQNRVLWGNGVGYLAHITSASTTANTVTAASATNYLYGWGGCFGTKYCYVDRRAITVDNTAGSSWEGIQTTEANGTISAVSGTTVTIAADASITEAAGDFLGTYTGFQDGTTTAPVPNEPWGLSAICASVNPDDVIGALSGTTITTGVTTDTYMTLGGLTTATYTNWKGNAVYNENSSQSMWQAPTALSLRSMQEAYFASVKNNFYSQEEGLPTAAYTTYPIFLSYGDTLIANRQYDGAAMTLDGGFKALSFNSIPVIPDGDAIDGCIYYVHEPSIMRFVMKEPEWLDKGEGILKWNAGYAGYIAVLEQMNQYGTDARNKHTIHYNIDAF